MNQAPLNWWNELRHGGMLLDAQRLSELIPKLPEAPPDYRLARLRREMLSFDNDPETNRGRLVRFLLETLCGFTELERGWFRGSDVSADWTRRSLTGEAIRPNHLWLGQNGGILPVFFDKGKQLGVGKGKQRVSAVLQWLRRGEEQLALLTNGRQWRILFAGLDYDAFCQWDADQWFTEGAPSEPFLGFLALVRPDLWRPERADTPCKLLQAIADSRKGQAELSQVLGERVRQAAEVLIQAHAQPLFELGDSVAPQEIYHAAVRIIMRLVVTLFAESREGLLPRDNAVFHSAYSLQGLREHLERTSPQRRAGSYSALPRILALFRLIHDGCSHEAMPVPAYDGDLFAAGDPESSEGLRRALHCFETACFNGDSANDAAVAKILDLLSRTQVKIRQGRVATWVTAPVDFSSLESEYIGILYEGLLDFELRQAAPEAPIVFLGVGNQPALPLPTLEAMDDKTLKGLLEKLKDKSSSSDPEGGEEEEDAELEADEENPEEEEEEEETTEAANGESEEEPVVDDARFTLQARAEAWARRAIEVGGLVKKPPKTASPEKRMAYDRAVEAKSRQIAVRVVLPGEWYLVRWGGTRKGSGTFYTRPQLTIPTVHRTLRPLCYDPPLDENCNPDTDAPTEAWTPKRPEEILDLKVCDPACGSGSFPLAALRFLTEALYRALRHHDRIKEYAGKAVLDLIYDDPLTSHQPLATENLPCRPTDDDFEPRTRAILRRYVVERCIYGVDLDPLAVELCRLSLWIETLDRNLPMTFLAHKIKCGNSLVGAWFDQFLHYPAMAWAREGGDKGHAGVHFAKEAWTKAIKDRADRVKTQIKEYIDHYVYGEESLLPIDLSFVQTGFETAEKALAEIHALGILEAARRAECYAALQENADFQRLRRAFDLWTALWFWPPDEIDAAPLPLAFYEKDFSEETWRIVDSTAAARRFFHWELEFPDVFGSRGHGFDAVLGNPPWDIAKPNSKEFFSAVDPMYRTYGKQEAIDKQKEFFELEPDVEREWLVYTATFKAMSNWTKLAGFPFGDRVSTASNGKQSHDLNLGDRGRGSFESSAARHETWRVVREDSSGYSADAEHSFRQQGGGDINLYKMFLEQAHALVRDDGRFGLIVPSGLYSDNGTGDLRRLFLERCRWEWLFSFINWDRIFQSVYYRFKFCIVVISKGQSTDSIHTAFGRYHVEDWEHPSRVVVDVERSQIEQFSPRTLAFVEVREPQDLQVLTKIYSGSVLLGDSGPDGWGVTYAREFDMTNDSKLFPPRPKWEEWGYRPDEYSRWIQGPWRPMELLWAELGVQPLPDGERRVAQPPYDRLPCPRADLPEGVLLSREATHYLHERDIPTVTFTDASGKPLLIKKGTGRNAKKEKIVGPAIALPLYEGRMIGQFDFSEKGWVSGKGRSAVWREIPWEQKQIEPQYLMGERVTTIDVEPGLKLPIMNIGSSTNRRTLTGAVCLNAPCNHALNPIRTKDRASMIQLGVLLNSLVFDSEVRTRLGGLNISFFVLDETAIMPKSRGSLLSRVGLRLQLAAPLFAEYWMRASTDPHIGWRSSWCLTPHERVRNRASSEAIVARLNELDTEEVKWLLRDCDYPSAQVTELAYSRFDPKGFWRVDKEKHPEHRLTVLSLVAFADLQEKIDACGGDVERGIEAFCAQNDGEGWMLPETLRLADYGLGHDDRAKHPQPVRECFGKRFYDWQLAQSPEESWRECRLHARNLLGKEGYQNLLDELAGKKKTKKKDEEDSYDDLPLFRQGK